MDGEDPEKPPRRKLIEVALPLEAINRESAREKSIRHGHPSTLHLWWARRPLAAARAVLFAQLVDDPSSHPDRFPTEEDQQEERRRLHGIIERLVVWENTRDKALLNEAHEEILNSTDGNPPPILDPFAGGGTIPLEAQRLGLEAHASDLNPVAVLINKALIEIPPKFANQPPVFPDLAGERTTWEGATGLAADVRAYGEWMRDEAKKRIGDHYPEAELPDGTKATVVAWVWARTVACPNPACGIEMPLVRSWWLSKKKGREAWVQPLVVSDDEHPSGKRVKFEIRHAPSGPEGDGTVSRSGATCIVCGSAAPFSYVRESGTNRGIGSSLMAIVAEGNHRRDYIEPSKSHVEASTMPRPDTAPEAEVPSQALGFRVHGYGMTTWADLFTNRQLLALTTFSDLVAEVRERVLGNALADGAPAGDRLELGGTDADAYADAVATYLAMCISKLADRGSTIVTWFLGRESTRNTFARQAIPMTWDFVEPNQFASGTGSWHGAVSWTAESLEGVSARPPIAAPRQADAVDAVQEDGVTISTDPPYYDNIGYSDLSDFFYVWLRRSLREVHPALLSTLLVPKAEELVANPFRHDGRDGAKRFFEDGFRAVFEEARKSARPDVPITVYYAFKQSDVGDDGTSSTGWETLLEGMIRSGWVITGTWPMRSELSNRMLGHGTNALASSIVLALRPRSADAQTTDRRGLISALQAELPDALRDLQQGAIAPVDLPQATIGPGMAVFTRFSKVIEGDGSAMTVRSALARINEILDQVLNEQEGDFDDTTRFAIAWYRHRGYEDGSFGDADNMARARNTSVEAMSRDGILESVAGDVMLFAPEQYEESYDPLADERVSSWEVLHNLIAALERGGLQEAGALLSRAEERDDGAIDSELLKELAFLLFAIAERNGWTNDAINFNKIATAWPEIVAEAGSLGDFTGTQGAFDLESEN